jgi:hypothetical protein
LAGSGERIFIGIRQLQRGAEPSSSTLAGGEDEHVVGGGFQVELQGGQPAVEIIHGDQGHDGDAQARRRGDERLADAAGDFFHRQLGLPIELKEPMMPVTVPSSPSSGPRVTMVSIALRKRPAPRSSWPEATSSAPSIEVCGWFSPWCTMRTTGSVLFKGFINTFQDFGAAFDGGIRPPEKTLHDDADGHCGHHQNGPHDGPTFDDEFDDDVG